MAKRAFVLSVRSCETTTMLTTYALCTGVLLDLLLGDPAWMSHPVIWMGKGIHFLEKQLRKRLPATPRGELWGGIFLALVLPLASLGLSFALLALAASLHPILRYALESWMCYRILATRELWRQSQLVQHALEAEDLSRARQAVGRIVGRDTESLDQAGVIKATVETVAENACDGVVAPLLFMAVGGAPLGMLYKAINTMDSMVGYKNDRYSYFGRAAARLDDVANWIPARLCALCMVLAAPLVRLSAKGAWRIWRRDGRNHASPNSAQTEAAAAGALGIQLAGDAVYAGKRTEKPTIGDATRPVESVDILRTNRLMLAAAFFCLLLCVVVRLALQRGG